MIKKILLLSVLVLMCACSKEESSIFKEDFLMDTVVSVKLYGTKDKRVIDEIFQRLEEIDETFDNYNSDSPIEKINNNPNTPTEVPDEAARLIERSLGYAKETDGHFNPVLGSLTKIWNISQGEKDRESIPSDEEVSKALSHIDFSKLSVSDNSVSINDTGAKLDLGAIVKGYAADEVKKLLDKEKIGAAVIDLGGNIMTYGKKSDGSPWVVGVRNPSESESLVFTYESDKTSTCVTSGNYERFFIHDGKRYHHIIDPETGFPSEGNWLSVSVVCESSEVADMLSTALFVAGPKRASEILKKFDAEAAFVMDDKRVFASGDFFSKIDKNSLQTDYEIYRLEDFND